MTITLALGVLATLLVVGVMAAVLTAIDRGARASAWQQIALERRWNHERRHQADQ